MIFRRLTTISLTVLVSVLPLAAADAPQFSLEDYRAAQKQFIANPLEDTKNSCTAIIGFATESEAVSVQIGKKEGVVWIDDASPGAKENSPILLCAYILGSVDSQLASKKKRHDIPAAIEAVLKTYSLIQKNDAKFELAGVEQLKRAKQKGKLREFLRSLE